MPDQIISISVFDSRNLYMMVWLVVIGTIILDLVEKW